MVVCFLSLNIYMSRMQKTSNFKNSKYATVNFAQLCKVYLHLKSVYIKHIYTCLCFTFLKSLWHFKCHREYKKAWSKFMKNLTIQFNILFCMTKYIYIAYLKEKKICGL